MHIYPEVPMVWCLIWNVFIAATLNVCYNKDITKET